jgi:hypothetical protein
MKKITFFFIPTLALATASCSAMKNEISLTHSQYTQHLPVDGWICISRKKEKNYSMEAERPYHGSIVATVLYQPLKRHISLQYSDTQTNCVYANSSFNFSKDLAANSIAQLNFAFFDGKTKVIIALENTAFILPVPFDVMYDRTDKTKITKQYFSYLWFLIKNCIHQSDGIEMSPKNTLHMTQFIMKKLYKSYKRI